VPDSLALGATAVVVSIQNFLLAHSSALIYYRVYQKFSKILKLYNFIIGYIIKMSKLKEKYE
jgi:hypothetical protein